MAVIPNQPQSVRPTIAVPRGPEPVGTRVALPSEHGNVRVASVSYVPWEPYTYMPGCPGLAWRAADLGLSFQALARHVCITSEFGG